MSAVGGDVSWAQISTDSDSRRVNLLSQALRDAGFANRVELIQSRPETFEADVRAACKVHQQLRVGGELCELLPSLTEKVPSSILTLKVADAYVKQGDEWWPRNFLNEGLQRAVVTDVKGFDLTGAVFILGSGCESRAAVAALARLGFSRFNVSDPNDEKGQKFIEDVKRSYFGVQFQFVPRHLITQLPSVHSVAINTLDPGADEGALSELYYFNFLKSGGLWLDLSLDPTNEELAGEAGAVGAFVEPGFRVAAWTDLEWSRTAFGVQLDVEAYATALKNAFAKSV